MAGGLGHTGRPCLKNMQEEQEEEKRGGEGEGGKGEMLRLWVKFKLSKAQEVLSGAHTTQQIQGYNPPANVHTEACDWAL